ncbi:MAG: hypothetical protein AB3N22_16405 [Ruegeria sp.]
MTEPEPHTPLFLERRSYRRRRVMDAMRLLPVLGVLLWLVPVLWPNAADGPDAPGPVSMSGAVVYVFVVWAGLILVGFCMWWAVFSGQGDNAERTPSEPEA